MTKDAKAVMPEELRNQMEVGWMSTGRFIVVSSSPFFKKYPSDSHGGSECTFEAASQTVE